MKTLIAMLLGLALGFAATTVEAKGRRTPGCCKTCRNSQPCGDSCIPYARACHKPPGCAC